MEYLWCLGEAIQEEPYQDYTTRSLAYATTIYKSQGSEYPVVMMPLVTQHFHLLERNLFYIGVTHGKRLIVLIA